MTGKLIKNRESAFLQQEVRCYYCKQPMWLDDPKDYSAKYGLTARETRSLQCTAEHLQPRRDGGGDESANIVAACLFCNRRRETRATPLSPERYSRYVTRRVSKGRWHGARILARLCERKDRAPSPNYGPPELRP